MQQALPTRELIRLDGLGVCLWGTYHKPKQPATDDADAGKDRASVVFVNSLSSPRASAGDGAVHLATGLAAAGYPSFRLDLPGFGDTYGAVPMDVLHFITEGSYGPIASSKIKELVQRFELSSLVIVGHCAGAITALYAAAERQECKGLVLMDPYFHLPIQATAKVRPGLVNLIRQTRTGRFFLQFYKQTRAAKRTLRRHAPPGNANRPLLAKWKQVASRGLPILILRSPRLEGTSAKLKLTSFDYDAHLVELAGHRHCTTIEIIEGTDHSFANTIGRSAVQHRIEAWLREHFPLAPGTETMEQSLFSAIEESSPELSRDYADA